MRNIVVLGSTGSIGESTLDVLQRHQERFEVIALSASLGVRDVLYETLPTLARVHLRAGELDAAEERRNA